MGRVSRGDPGRGKGGWIGGREGGKSEKWTVWEPIRLGLVFFYDSWDSRELCKGRGYKGGTARIPGGGVLRLGLLAWYATLLHYC